MNDINSQVRRIQDYYGSGSRRAEKAWGIADRYTTNIYNTKEQRNITRQIRDLYYSGQREKSRAIDNRNERKYSRRTYMGLSAG